jgi:hypothetical protein
MKSIARKAFCILHSSFCIAVAVATAKAVAATGYVVPWYANPTAVDTAYDAGLVSAFDPAVAPLSTAWATVANDANVASQTIVAKRMSHSDYFRPRLYALRADGAIVIYTLTKTLDEIKWTTVYSSSDLIARVNYNGGSLATGQTVTSFEVVDKDGETAFVQFDNSGTWQAIANSHPKWTYYSANIAGNPSTGSEACLTDGRWILKSSWANSAIQIGNYTASNIAYDGGYMGEYLDLYDGVSTAANNGAKWNIAQFVYGLKADASGKSPRVIVHSNKLVTQNSTAGMQNLQPEELVFDAAGITRLAKWSRPNEPEKVKKMFLSFPGLQTIDEYGYGSTSKGIGEETDFADVVLPALRHVGEYGMAKMLARGTLELPAIVAVSNNAFYGCDNMEELRLSAERNTLAHIGSWTFGAEGQLGSLRRVTLGCADGFVFSSTGVFSRQPLEIVTFTGAVPGFTAATVWPDTAANTMVFAIPEGVAAWDAVAAAATPLSEEQRRACHAAHPDWPIPFGVVAPSVFNSNHSQYLAYIGHDSGVSLAVERDTFFDDTVAITSDWAPFADGTYPKGTTITLSVTPNANGTFVKWYGDVARDEEESATITIKLDSDKWVYARIVHPWTLAADKATMSNGNFTVNCSVVDESARTLQVGISWRTGVGGIYANDDGCGVLDLGGPITMGGEGSQWTVARMSSGDAAWAAPTSAKVDVFITPSTLTSAYDNSATAALNATGAGAYSTVILDEPNASWPWTRNWYCAQGTRLRHLVLRLAKLTAMSAQYSFSGCSGLTATKLDWWDLGSLSSIGSDSWRIGSTASSPRLPASGTLSLPSYRSIAGTEFQSMANVESFVLGGNTKDTTVTNIAANAFSGDTSLKRLVLHADAGIVVGATPFANGQTPDEIVFTGAAPRDSTVFDNLFAGVSAGSAPSIARIPVGTAAWMSTSYIDYAPSAAEKALAGDEAGHVFGVFRGEDGGASFVKALCVMDRAPAALVITVR